MGRILREDSITVAGNGRISGIIVPMALSATVFAFDVDLADSDRQVYEQLSLRLARHPSESDEFLVARLLAYCLEYTEGIEFSRGLSDADDPPIAVCDLTGRLRAWIDVGTPAAERLHRAGKAADRVVVYVHKEHRQWLRQLEGAVIHRRDGLVIQAFDPAFVAAFVARLERRMGGSSMRNPAQRTSRRTSRTMRSSTSGVKGPGRP